jgi:hypothetical protein
VQKEENFGVQVKTSVATEDVDGEEFHQEVSEMVLTEIAEVEEQIEEEVSREKGSKEVAEEGYVGNVVGEEQMCQF